MSRHPGRLHEVVEERAAVLLVDGDVPAVLVEVDAVWLPRQRRDPVSRLQGALVRAAGVACSLKAAGNPLTNVAHLKRAPIATTVPPGRDELSRLRPCLV